MLYSSFSTFLGSINAAATKQHNAVVGHYAVQWRA